VTSSEYNKFVARGKKIITRMSDAKWELGDLAVQVFPPRNRGRNQVSRYREMLQFGRDIGMDVPARIEQYRNTSIAWPRAQRRAASWSTHWLLNGHPQRFELMHDGMRFTEAQNVRVRRGPVSRKKRGPFDAIRWLGSAESFTKSAAAVLGVTDPTPDQLKEVDRIVSAIEDQLDAVRAATDRRAVA